MITLLLYLFLALFISFLCSIMEAVLLSTPQSFLYVKQDQGYTWAKSLLNMKVKIDKPLSAILSLNTVAHTIGAAGVGGASCEGIWRIIFWISVGNTNYFNISINRNYT